MMDALSAKENLLLHLKNHHVGAENFITSEELESTLEINGVTVRQIVNKLRCEHQPICNDTNGYYYAKNICEIRDTASQLLNRTKKIIDAVDGLNYSQQPFSKGV